MSFAASLAFVLEREGGFVNDPADRGGATKYGITRATLARARGKPVSAEDVRALRITEAARIYELNYWSASGCPGINDERLALCVFDAAVNHGPAKAIKLLQKALGITEDGVFGPLTLKAVHVSDPRRVVADYLELRAAFFRRIVENDPTQLKFLKGWLARCRHIAREVGIPIGAGYAE